MQKTSQIKNHISRDIAYDSHAYRRENWKLIVGNHLTPFGFHQVYEEPNQVKKSSFRIIAFIFFRFIMDVN